MKIYIITQYSIINGIRQRKVFKAYSTEEAANAAMNDVYRYWMSEAEKYTNPKYIIDLPEDNSFVIYNIFKPERFTVDCFIVEVELCD